VTAEPSPFPGTPAAPHSELVVDWSAFLPEGVTAEPADHRPHGDASGDGADDPAQTSTADQPTQSAPSALDRLETDLDGVDAALLAMDAGSYGACGTCGERVDDRLLATDPTRTACAHHDPPDLGAT